MCIQWAGRHSMWILLLLANSIAWMNMCEECSSRISSTGLEGGMDWAKNWSHERNNSVFTHPESLQCNKIPAKGQYHWDIDRFPWVSQWGGCAPAVSNLVSHSMTEVHKCLRHCPLKVTKHELLHLFLSCKVRIFCSASSQVLVLVRLRRAVWGAIICFTLSASPLSPCNEISLTFSFVKSLTCTTSSSALIAAKYCCLNLGLASRVDRLSLCPVWLD